MSIAPPGERIEPQNRYVRSTRRRPSARILTTQDRQFNEKEQWRHEILVTRENVEEPHVWRNISICSQAAQKVRPARPQPMKAPEA